MMRKIVTQKITWKYVGGEDTEKKKESKETVRRAYDRIFSMTRKSIL